MSPNGRELFYIVWRDEMLNYNTFPLLQESELCSSFSNNGGGEFWNSDTTNIQIPTFKSSLSKPTCAGRVIPEVPRKSKNSGVSFTIIQHKFAQAM